MSDKDNVEVTIFADGMRYVFSTERSEAKKFAAEVQENVHREILLSILGFDGETGKKVSFFLKSNSIKSIQILDM